MPFDGATQQPPAVRMIDALENFFGPKGEKWTQGEWSNAAGARCVRSALVHLRSVHKVRGDRAAHYLRLAAAELEATRLKQYIPLPYPLVPLKVKDCLVTFNDDCADFAEMTRWLGLARAFAVADAADPLLRHRGRALSGVQRRAIALAVLARVDDAFRGGKRRGDSCLTLLVALESVSAMHRLPSRDAALCLARAGWKHAYDGLVPFSYVGAPADFPLDDVNDQCMSYRDIKALIDQARDYAAELKFD